MIEALGNDPIRPLEVGCQPIMVIEVAERPDHLTPIRDAFPALCGIPDHCPPIEHQHIMTKLRELGGPLSQLALRR